MHRSLQTVATGPQVNLNAGVALQGSNVELVRSYLEALTVDRALAANTLAAYQSDLEQFSIWLGTQKSLLAVQRAEVRRFLAYLLDAGCGPSSVRRKLSSLRQLYRFAVLEGHCKRDPCRNIRSPKVGRRLPRHLAETEVQKLVGAALGRGSGPLALRDQAIVLLLYSSGLRVSELVNAQLPNLDLENHTLKVFGKGSKWRIVPLSTPAAEALRLYLAEARPKLLTGETSRALFISRQREPFTRQCVSVILGKLGRACGLKVNPHSLRHSCATHLLEGGADLVSVQTILGHADILTTGLYVHLSQKYLRSVHIASHPRGGRP